MGSSTKITEGSATPPEVGHILHRLRLAQKLTLDELARASDVSKSVLSQIERDQTNPTVGTLWRLANALGVRIEDLLRSPGRGDGICVVDEHTTPVLVSSDRRCRIRVLGPVEMAGRLEWYEMRFDPRGALVSEPHEPGTVEHLTVLEGKVEVESGTAHDRAVLATGQTARYRADQAHAIRNPFDAPAVVIVVVTSAMHATPATRAAANRKARPRARASR
jgi:transcriptional regulator with XRE-family HTH domain